MLIFGLHDGERITLDVQTGMTVRDVREMIQTLLNITVDLYKHDKKVLVLSWAGSDLQDPWIFSDLGIVPGTTIRVNLRDEVKPVLHIRCSHSLDTISLYDTLVIGHMFVDELRSIASRKTGLPIGIFRLVAKDSKEMYDGHRLEDYGIDVGHTVLLENLDGWNEFLNLSIMGFTPQVVSQLTQDENMGRYQMKVALFLAAHFGHVDLARSMLRLGAKASEPVGYPPQRMWCTEDGHIESKKAAVHQAVEMGQLGVLRLFVNTDITVITAKDGNDLAPLNIALRKKIKNCASFLLTKQWSKVNITKTFALHVGTYTHLRQWCDRAKERAFMKYGYSKTSLKRRPSQTGPLVGFGVTVDGFSPSIMTGKSKAQQQRERDREKKKLIARQSMAQLSIAEAVQPGGGGGGPGDPEAYFKQMNAVQSLKSMGDKVKASRWGRVARAPSKPTMDASTERSQVSVDGKAQRSPEPPKVNGEGEEPVRLPPIMQKLRSRLINQSQASVTTIASSSDTKERDVAHLPAPPGEKKEERSMMSKLVKSRGSAYFMAGGAQPATHQPQPPPPPQQQQGNQGKTSVSQSQGLQQGVRSLPSLPLAPSDRFEVESQAETTTTSRMRSVFGGDSVDTASTLTTAEDLLAPHPPPPPKKEAHVASTRAANADPSQSPTKPAASDDAASNTSSTRKKGKKKKGRVSSALLLSKAKSSEGSIPLPLISNEQDRRPFFYYNGQRDDDFLDPTINTWSRHRHSAGTTPRERAIKSLTVANTFKDKPWLGQVRIALRIAANPTKRNVRRLRSATKRTFAIQ